MGSGETGFRGYAVEFRTDLIQTACGRFATRDFGGSGPDLLFVHGTGHNLEVWSPLAERLRGQFRMVAFDLRGHGQTPEESTDPEQYWRDLGGLVSAMGLRRPLLVGHSTGGYAVSAYAAAVGECSGIVVLDGFVLDGRKTPEEAKGWYLPREQLWDLFRYGWVASGNDMERYIGEVCSKAPEDWLNAGVDPALVGAFTRRSFVQRGGRFVRRPSMEEIAAVSLPDPAQPIYPAIDLYDRIHVPAGFVLASNGLYGSREADLMKVVGAGANRRFLRLECGHNVHMLKAQEIAAFIAGHFRQESP
jgi:pimeloyl-ACP methyl ester carboxylesterase